MRSKASQASGNRSLTSVKVVNEPSKGSAGKKSGKARAVDPEIDDRDDYDRRLEESKKQILKDMKES